MSAVLKHIAAIANKAELHVLIELAARAEAAGGHDAVASSRDLAERMGLVRASVRAAIDSLNKKAVLWSDAGAAVRQTLCPVSPSRPEFNTTLDDSQRDETANSYFE